MASKTNVVINGTPYYKLTKKVGLRQNKAGAWVSHYKAFYGASKKEAEAKYAEFMAAKSRAMNSNKALGELIDEWIDTTFMSSGLSDNTKSKYTRAYEAHFRPAHIAGVAASEVTARMLQDYYNEVSCSPSALRSVNNLLRRFFRYAATNNICQDITASVELPVAPKKRRFKSDSQTVEVWTDDELRALLAALDGHRLRFLVIMALNTGARISELLALNYSDIRDGYVYINKQLTNVHVDGFSGPRLSGTKTESSSRVIPLNDAVLEALKIHRASHLVEMGREGYKTDRVFTTKTGRYYDRRSVNHALLRFYKSHGLPRHTFHSFRHTFGTNLSRAGVPIEETAALMGHSSIEITAKYYIEISADRKRSAVDRLMDFTK